VPRSPENPRFLSSEPCRKNLATKIGSAMMSFIPITIFIGIFLVFFFAESFAACGASIEMEKASLARNASRHEGAEPARFNGSAYAASRYIIVDKGGRGEFRSIQAAIDSVPENNREWVFIQINAGVYK
jgi:hypothetical protein